MAVAPNAELDKAAFQLLVGQADLKLPYGPYSLFEPSGFAQYFDLLPPFAWTDRGFWDPTQTYNAGDLVTFSSPQTGFTYKFVCVLDDTTEPPLTDSGNPPDSFTWQQPWWSCYQRIRDDAHIAAGNGNGSKLATYQQAVSGPWPITVPDINYDQLAFYYPDTGKQESVTITGILFPDASDPTQSDPFPIATAQNISCVVAPSMFQVNPEPSEAAENVPEELVFDDQDVNGNGTATFQAFANDAIKVRFINSCTFEVKVGGTIPLPLNVVFRTSVAFRRGLTIQDVPGPIGPSGTDNGDFDQFIDDNTDPTSLVVVDTTGWFPGATFAAEFSGWGPVQLPEAIGGNGGPEPQQGGVAYTCTLNQVVQPGTYTVTFKSNAAPNFRADGQLSLFGFTDMTGEHTTTSGMMEWIQDTFGSVSTTMTAQGTSVFVSNSSVEVPGIHDTKRVLKIPVSNFGPDGTPPGIIGVYAMYDFEIRNGQSNASGNVSAGIPPSDGPVDVPSVLFPGDTGASPTMLFTFTANAMTWSIAASTIGYWFAKALPISSAGILPFDRMPWNQFPTAARTGAPLMNKFLGYTLPYVGPTAGPAGPAYEFEGPDWIAGTDNVEMNPCPKLWKPNVFYPAGFVIEDSNGNLQRTNNAGRSAPQEPTWPFTAGAVTSEPKQGGDPQLGWTLFKAFRPGPTWKPNTDYPIGQTVIDNNGNQVTSVVAWLPDTDYDTNDTMIDGNNNLQQVQTAGTSGPGPDPPQWGITMGAMTTDGSVVWKLIGTNTPPESAGTQPIWSTTFGGRTDDNTVVWKMTRFNPKLTPAVARFTPPVYPNYWQNNPKGATLPILKQGYLDINGNPIWDFGFTIGGPTSFNPPPGQVAGPNWWIYRVAINRIPQGKTIQPPPTAAIPVTIGCIRNGAFVAFGTYQTGQIIDAMWPVFIAEALAFQAGEMVDVQAEFITCGGNYQGWGNIGYPIMAAHINDITAILNQL